MASVAALVLGVGLVLGGVTPVHADKVGVAAAVNPDAFSSLSGVPNKQLNIGKSIFYNERINTTASGLVQVLLVDGSTFTVGPNSDLVIDKFVYDPRKKTGELVATFSKGTMRFIGGKLSKNEGGVKVNTPAGSLAIRGGMVQGSIPKGIFSFLYGDSLTYTGNNGQAHTVYQPGYTLDLSSGAPTVRPTTPQDTNSLMQALSGSGTVVVGGQGDQPPGPNNNQTAFQTISLQDLISDATATQVDSTLQQEENNILPPNNTDNPPPNNTDNNPPPNNPDPLPQRTTGTYNGYAAGYYVDEPFENESNDIEVGRLANLYPESVSVTFDAAQNSVSGNFLVRSYSRFLPLGFPVEGGARFAFGEPSIFGSDSDYFATANQVTIIEFGRPDITTTSVAGSLTSGLGGPLCKNCEFLRWGSWLIGLTYEDGYYNDVAQTRQAATIGWWVAGDIPTLDEIASIDQGIATYDGTTIGTVIQKLEGAWVPYRAPAAGTVHMNWDFADRSGLMEISNFKAPKVDGLTPPPAINLSGTMRIPGQLDGAAMNRFRGGLTGNVGGANGASIAGFANGSFARNGSDPVGGIAGNWSASNPHLRANAIFGASKTGFNPAGTLGPKGPGN